MRLEVGAVEPNGMAIALFRIAELIERFLCGAEIEEAASVLRLVFV